MTNINRPIDGIACTRLSSKHFIHLFDPHKNLIIHWRIQRRWENLGKWEESGRLNSAARSGSQCLCPMSGNSKLCKGPESIWVLWALQSLWQLLSSASCTMQASIDNTQINGCWFCSSTAVLMDTKVYVSYNFHMSKKYYYLFFQLLGPRCIKAGSRVDLSLVY